MRGSWALVALVACGTQTTLPDGGVAGLCDPNAPPIPSSGCARGDYVCMTGDPGETGCTPNTFCFDASAGPSAGAYACYACNPPAPDGGCGDASLCTYNRSFIRCESTTFCGTANVNSCALVDASE